jgi:hypothetical protein
MGTAGYRIELYVCTATGNAEYPEIGDGHLAAVKIYLLERAVLKIGCQRQ